MRTLKQSTAANCMVLMVDETDHITGLAGLTLTITASKNGAAFASITPTVTDRGDGWYNLALTTTHTNTLGDLALHITSTGADTSDVLYDVTEGAAAEVLAGLVDGAYTVSDVLKILSAISAGQTTITDLGGGAATLVFRNLSDTTDTVTATMADSERTTLVYDL